MKIVTCLMKKMLFGLLILILLAGCGIDTDVPVTEQVSLESLMAGLETLPAEAFMAEAYKRLILRDPEQVTAIGLSGLYDTDNDQLCDYTLESLLLTQAFEAALLAQAQSYAMDSLSDAVRLDLRVFIWYLSNRVAGHPYQWFSSFLLDREGFLVDQYVYFLMVQHPFESRQDVEDYIDRLTGIGDQVDQIIALMERQAQAGVRLPYALYNAVMEELGMHRWQVGRKTPFVTVLAVRMHSADFLTQEDRESYYRQASEAADAFILPAFERLMDYLYTQADQTIAAVGLLAQPEGLAIYQYLLDTATTLSMTPEDIHALGQAEVERLGQEVRLAAEAMGYDADLPLQEVFRQAKVDRNYALGLDIFVTFKKLLMDVETGMDEMFYYDIDNDLVMVPVFEGGFYEPAGLDQSRRSAFYAGFTGREAHFDMPTIIYHETFPGRHFLYSVEQGLDLPLFRKAIAFPAFEAGWAQYAAFLAWEMGMYADDPNANLGRLQNQLVSAAMLVVDTGIHAFGWTAQEAARYLVTYAGINRSEANEMVLVHTAQPGKLIAGYVGFTKLIELRETAEQALGENFDIRDFHAVVLGSGSLPLPLLEENVMNYIQSNP